MNPLSQGEAQKLHPKSKIVKSWGELGICEIFSALEV
jgi:hypothetical protein